MAAKAHSTPAPSIATALLAKATASAAGKMSNISVLSKTLADLMEEVHGGACHIHIDHKGGVVMLVVRHSAIVKPRSGEVA